MVVNSQLIELVRANDSMRKHPEVYLDACKIDTD
jgi:hypothetical protein